MLNSLTFTILIGTALGFLTGLGIGGGSLLIIWLTVVLGTDPITARSTNLLFFLPAAIIACIFRIRQGSLTVGKVIPAVVAGCIGAGLFSFFSTILNVEILKKTFGIVLIIAGFRELFYRPRNAR